MNGDRKERINLIIVEALDKTVDFSNTERLRMVDMILMTAGKDRELRAQVQQLLGGSPPPAAIQIPDGMSTQQYKALYNGTPDESEARAIRATEHLCDHCVFSHMCIVGVAAHTMDDALPAVSRCLSFGKVADE